MHSFELTDRGKIAVAVLVVIPILILSIILAVLAMAANVPDDPPDVPPDEPSASENHEIILLPEQAETPKPPENGGFPPLSDNNESDNYVPDGTISGVPPTDDTQSDDANDDDSSNNGEANTLDSTPASDPSLNLSTGQLSFYFTPHIQSSLDRVTSNLLNAFLNLPDNTPENTIAIETPALSSDDSGRFMSVITSALGERNIDSRRITHIINPELPVSEQFEVIMYFIIQEEK